MVRERRAVRVRPTEVGWLLLSGLTTVVLSGCGPRRPFDPTRMNPDLAMGRGMTAVRVLASTRRSRDPASLPHLVLVGVKDRAAQGRSMAARVPARQLVVVPAGESILGLVRKLSHRPLTVREEVEVITEVKRLNPHIFNPDIVRPGTRVVLPGCIGCDEEAERDGGV